MTSRPDLLFGSTWSIEGDSVVRGKSGDTTRKLILSPKEKKRVLKLGAKGDLSRFNFLKQI